MSLRAGSTIALASSGSRSSISSIEPLMSAKRAVTVLRSPSRFSEAEASVTRIGPSSDFFADAGAADSMAVPHFLQNRAPGLTAALHSGQVSSSFEPQCSQNAASDGLSVLHDEHNIWLNAQLIEQ